MLTIEEYHQGFSSDVIEKLNDLRRIIHEAVPNLTEHISYNMPAFKLKRSIVYYAAYKNHIGFYPTSKPIEKYKNYLSDYKHSKGAIQFKFNEPFPEELIKKMVQYSALINQ